MEQGDSFEFSRDGLTRTMYVLQSDLVLINNELKKRLVISPEPTVFVEGIGDTIVENIGSLQGLLKPLCPVCYGAFHELLCYTENGELVYQNPKREKCYYSLEDITSIPTVEINDCNISPNPVDDILHISGLNNVILRVEIFDNVGRQVYNQAYKDIINVSSFSKGLYLLKVYAANGQVSEFKFIKK